MASAHRGNIRVVIELRQEHTPSAAIAHRCAVEDVVQPSMHEKTSHVAYNSTLEGQ